MPKARRSLKKYLLQNLNTCSFKSSCLICTCTCYTVGGDVDLACYDGDEDTASSTKSMVVDADLDQSIHDDISTSPEDLMAEHGYTVNGEVDLGTVSGDNDKWSADDVETETSMEDD